MRPDMHAGGVVPDEERLARLDGALHVIQRRRQKLIVGSLHPFLGKRAGVLAGLLAPGAEARISGRGIVGGGGFALEDATRSKLRPEAGVLRIVDVFGLFLGIQVIEIAEKLIKPVDRRQEFVAIAKMVLAILEGHVAQRLEQFGERRILFLKADGRSRQPNFGQTGANWTLPGNERSATGGAALLRLVVREQRALVGQSVNVGSFVAHHALVIGTDVPIADVITEDDEDVRLFRTARLRMCGCTAAREDARHGKRTQRQFSYTCSEIHAALLLT